MSRASSLARLCPACQDIFSSPQKLAYGSINPWRQTPQSFREALREGCHLCHLIDERRNHNLQSDDTFPVRLTYAFKPLNPQWARYGTGPKWYAVQGTVDAWTDPEVYLREFEKDPTPNKLGTLLATDAENLVQEAANSWLVLELHGEEHITLPMELWAAGDTFGKLAQTNLDSQTSTSRPETLRLAQAWLQNCLDNHPSCGSRQPEHWLPTRLLDVGSPEAPSLRLVSGASLDANPPYVALSHRWGNSKTFMLKSSDLAAYQTTIPSSNISDTVRDAAAVTRALGIRYMWVDFMCIIQDDDGQDFAHEAETMYKVYGLSTCTIAAVNSGHGDGGFFAERSPYHVRACRVPNPFKTDSQYSFSIMGQYLNRIYEEDVRRSEWFQRGWVFQERILAPRLLIFSGKQILWGCGQLQAGESWPRGKTSENHIDQFASVEVDKARLFEVLDPRRGISKTHAAWWTFLQDYMPSELTVRSDRLPAIQGIAALVAAQTGERYCSGFWLTDDLPHALLWRAKDILAARPAEYRAPSFSWASVEGGVLFNTTAVSEEEGEGDGEEEEDTPKRVTSALVHVMGGVQLAGSPSGEKTRNVREALKMSGSILPVSFLSSRSGEGIERAMTREVGLKWMDYIGSKEFEELERRREEERMRKEEADREAAAKREEVWSLGRLAAFMVWTCCVQCVLAVISGLFTTARRFMPFRAVPWGTVLPPYQICCAESASEDEEVDHERDMQRRQREAQARADRVFADLEKGVRFDEPKVSRMERLPTGEDVEYVKVEFFSDLVLPARQVIDVFWLPLLRTDSRTDSRISGLVVKAVEGGDKRYERLGTFETGLDEMTKLPCPLENEEFLLA